MSVIQIPSLSVFLGTARRDWWGQRSQQQPERGQPRGHFRGSIQTASRKGRARPVKSQSLQRTRAHLHSRNGLRRPLLSQSIDVYYLKLENACHQIKTFKISTVIFNKRVFPENEMKFRRNSSSSERIFQKKKHSYIFKFPVTVLNWNGTPFEQLCSLAMSIIT